MNLTRAFLEGFPGETEIRQIHVAEKDIHPCRGCFCCWNRTPGKCVVQDDMQEIYSEIMSSDVILLSFPLYFFGMPSQLKAALDRCLPMMLPWLADEVKHSSATTFSVLRYEELRQKKLVVITSCGYTDADAVYPALLEQLRLICEGDQYTAILCPEGELFVADKAHRQKNAYLNEIKEAGMEFSRNLCLSDETKKRLKQPMLSPLGFQTLTAAHWKLSLEENKGHH